MPHSIRTERFTPTRDLPPEARGGPTPGTRARSSPAVIGALFGGTTAALVLATVIVCLALANWLRRHVLADADWLVASDVCLIVLAAAAAVRLFSMKRGSLVLGRVACACVIVYYNLAIRPGTWLDAYAGRLVMLACLASYAVLATRFAKDALALCRDSAD